MQRLKYSIVLALVFVLGVAMAFAQTSNGTLAGTVTDPSGAAIPGATVSAKSVQTGDTRTTTTNSLGAYRLDSISPGAYVVTVTANGFNKTEISNVQVPASVITSINPSLKVGSAETVEVQASALTLKTESGELSSTIPTEEVADLPIANVNPYSLALTLPGVTQVNTTDFTNGTSYSVNGTRPRANNFLIEGQDNNDAGIHGQGLQPGNLDAIKEVTFLTNSYSAEFGHGGGSVANVIYKSGSNQFHGSLWDRLYNSALNANDKQDLLYGNPKSKSRENQFGFSFGGPVVHDKLFFFSSYQWDKYRSTANLSPVVVPTAAGVATLQGLTSNSRVTDLLSAIGNLRGETAGAGHQFIQLGKDPVSGIDRGAVEVGPTQRSLGANYDSPEFDNKVDWIASSKDNVSFRYIKSNFTAPYDVWNYPSQLPGFDATQYGVAHNAGISYTHTFSPTLLNEFRVSYGRIGFTFDFAPGTYNNPLALGPSISITGLTGFGAPGGDPQSRFHNTFQYQDSLSWAKGNHFIKIGADIADIRVRDAVPFNYYGSFSYTRGTNASGYTGLANYIDDFSGINNSTMSQNFGDPIARPRMLSQNYFVQDTWKLRTNFTLDYGFRYEFSGAPFNSMKNPALKGTCFTCYTAQQADGADYGPRVGFAYTPRFLRSVFGDNKTVIRGGVGVFYDQLFTNIIDNIQATAPATASPQYIINTTAYGSRGVANWSQYLTTLPQSANAFNLSEPIVPHMLNPETFQWNLNVQRELPGQFLATVAYVGTRGEHLLGNTELNPVVVGTSSRLFTDRGRIVLRDNSGDSIYHGLDASLERKFSHGLMFRGAYTYSKLMDDTSEIFTGGNWSSYPVLQFPSSRKQTDWAPSAFDHRQRLALSYVYAIPSWKRGDNGFVKGIQAVINNWQFSGTTAFQSGSPANVEVGYDVNGDGISNDRPVLGNANAPLASYAFEGESWMGSAPGTWCDGYYAWNTNDACHVVDPSSVHWLVPAYHTNANNLVARNSLFTPWTQNWDFSLQRTIKLRERHQFDIRAEMFNVFNHGNFNPQYASYTLVSGVQLDPKDTTFAQSTPAQTGHRSVRFLLRYSF